MKKNLRLAKKIQMSLGVYVLALLMLSMFALNMGCKGSYIAGYSLDPDTTDHNSTIFSEIIDSTGHVHWYVKLYDGEVWCYFHNRYEMVKRVRR
jgi:hypothetical protein